MPHRGVVFLMLPIAASMLRGQVYTSERHRLLPDVTHNRVAAGDFDGDGDADLATLSSSQLQIVRNDGQGRFMLYAAVFPMTGAAIAAGDIDGDGDLDLALLSLQGLRMLENRSPSRRFARVRLEAAAGDLQAIGAQVVLKAGGATQRDFVKATAGFATQLPLDLHFGLGSAASIDEIEIKWRDGTIETHRALPVDRRIVIRQGAAPRVEEIPRWTAPPRTAGRVKGAPGVQKEGGFTLVHDAEGRLRRAFYRPVTDEEVAATVSHLGKGTFHADFTAVATYHLSRREFDLADRALARAIEMNARYPISHYYLGHLRGMQNRHPEAVEAFRRATTLDPGYRQAWHNLGIALYKARQLPDAAAALTRAIELGDGAESRHVLGQVTAESGRLGEAVPHLKRAIELDPNRAEAHGDLGKILMAMGMKAEAETHLKRAIELDGSLAEAKENLRKLQGR
jgi:Tfp pilus assembly protein PilF